MFEEYNFKVLLGPGLEPRDLPTKPQRSTAVALEAAWSLNSLVVQSFGRLVVLSLGQTFSWCFSFQFYFHYLSMVAHFVH